MARLRIPFGHARLERNIESIGHTVDSNGDCLVEDISISSNKGWDLAELVDLKIIGRYSLCRFGFDNVDFNVVSLGNSADGSLETI